MGSLTSRPKVPSVQQPQIVYIQSPTLPNYGGTVPGGAAGGSGDAGADGSGGADGQIAQREKNLLSASRGRLGTVTTSFRGLLGLAGGAGQRKTLLGE